MHETLPHLLPTDFPAMSRKPLEILQINIGLRCNLACLHCHVNSNPYRKEKMSDETIEQVIGCLEKSGVHTLDITGGAPEMHPRFRYLVEQAVKRDIHVIDRCNLTILGESGYEDLAKFLARQRVEIIASLPCYTEDNVDAQRGKGVFEGSISALRKLNALGYGKSGSGLELNLVYNPLGPSLPPSQETLEKDYKARLFDDFGIEFNALFTLCNMPIKRFGSTLLSKGRFDEYMELLKSTHNNENLENVMCRNMVSVDWEGFLYDCDFNQMLGLNIMGTKQHKLHLKDLLQYDLTGREIRRANHCYGCTAGQGSSCGGALN